eukprot:scaffold2858_cov659-Pavlova_lutheri.AAC.33
MARASLSCTCMACGAWSTSEVMAVLICSFSASPISTGASEIPCARDASQCFFTWFLKFTAADCLTCGSTCSDATSYVHVFVGGRSASVSDVRRSGEDTPRFVRIRFPSVSSVWPPSPRLDEVSR